MDNKTKNIKKSKLSRLKDLILALLSLAFSAASFVSTIWNLRKGDRIFAVICFFYALVGLIFFFNFLGLASRRALIWQKWFLRKFNRILVPTLSLVGDKMTGPLLSFGKKSIKKAIPLLHGLGWVLKVMFILLIIWAGFTWLTSLPMNVLLILILLVVFFKR